MPLVTGDITKDGAVIDVLVGVSRNRQSRLEGLSFAAPPKVAVRAVIDTGSFVTAFKPRVFTSLGIEQPFRFIELRTPSTKPGEPFRCGQFDVSVTLVSGDTQEYLPSVHAIASDDFDQEEEAVQALLGRDILDRCVFSYYGPHKTFQLGF